MKQRLTIMPYWKYILYLREPVTITRLIDNVEYAIPRPAGLYGFTTVSERDKTVSRLNAAAESMEQIAIAVEQI
jgi:hypothetical protein